MSCSLNDNVINVKWPISYFSHYPWLRIYKLRLVSDVSGLIRLKYQVERKQNFAGAKTVRDLSAKPADIGFTHTS